ncbi:MAG: DNA gyrase modulator, partial [Rhodospirillaceae bacterium]
MSSLSVTDDLFFNRAGLDLIKTEAIIADALASADDGELFLEYSQSESFSWDDGRLKKASYDTANGFGLRAVADEATGYAHASILAEDALRRAGATVKAVHAGYAGNSAVFEPPIGTNRILYSPDNPLLPVPFAAKVKLLADIDDYARSLDSRVRQVSIGMFAEWQAVQIIRADGCRVADLRPLVRLSVSVICADGERMEHGS